MEAEPPYLFVGGVRTGSGVSVVGDVDTGVIEVKLRGPWTSRLCLDVHAVLRKCLAEHPDAIIVDLGELGDPTGASANMWLIAARAAAALRPPVQVVLSMPPTRQLASRLRRLGSVRFAPIFVTMKQARDAVATRRPLTDRLLLSRLEPERVSVLTACDLVAIACDAWGLPTVASSSRLIMSELVTNAVEHARTEMSITVARRNSGLYVAVRDRSPRMPNLRQAPPGGAGARPNGQVRGLGTVHRQASAWGAMPAEPGKVVWAIVRPRAEQPR